MKWIATAGYGLEGILAREIRDLGYQTTDVQTSRVAFEGDAMAGVRANLWLRTAGRVRLEAGAFEAHNFDELFEEVRALPWEQYLDRDSAFPVTCRLVNSDIVSPSDSQAIVKKAVAQRLGGRYGIKWFPEKGPQRPIEVHIHQNKATLSIDTSGAPLHRRGYRVLNAEAALRETLAAALVLLSGWRSDAPFADPFCGSGTLCVEAALIGQDRAPGLSRSFAGEDWPAMPRRLWSEAREEARDRVRTEALEIRGGDIDDQVLSMARTHARKAGVQQTIRFERADARRFTSALSRGCWVTNPPYGKRLSDEKAVNGLFRDLAPVMAALGDWSFHILSPHPRLEGLLGRKAGRRRVLYNGPIACRYYEFWNAGISRSPSKGADHASFHACP